MRAPYDAQRTAAVLALEHYREIRARALAASNFWPLVRRLDAAYVRAAELVPDLRSVRMVDHLWWLHPDYHPEVDVLAAMRAGLAAKGDA